MSIYIGGDRDVRYSTFQLVTNLVNCEGPGPEAWLDENKWIAIVKPPAPKAVSTFQLVKSRRRTYEFPGGEDGVHED